MVSDQFRRQLRQEAQQWQVDGLINPDQYRRLAEIYQLDTLDTQSRDRFIAILLGLGSILLGLGAITFVAANWQAISRELKLLLLMSVFWGFNITGYYLWQRPNRLSSGPQPWSNRLGQGFLLLGGLLLGANLALVSQLYHRSGSPYELCLIWGLGVLAMAFSLGLVSLGALAIALVGLGYWWGIYDLTTVGLMPGFNLLIYYMPLIAGPLFVLLAYRCQSRVLFAMGAIALMSSVQTTILELAYTISDQKAATVMWSAIAFTLPAALLWSYRDELWSTLQLPGLPMEKPFQPIARGVMLASMMMVSYGLSFHGVWANFYMISQPAQQAVKPLFMEYLPIVLNPNVLILGLLTLVGWVCLLRPAHDQGHWGLTERDTTILLLLVVLTGVPIWNYIVQPIAVVATFIINSVVFVLATGLMRQGLARGDRLPFWSGLMFLTVTILSRFFEYNTSLLFKSLAFGLCGLGIILIGLWFERNIRTLTRLSVPLEETP